MKFLLSLVLAINLAASPGSDTGAAQTPAAEPGPIARAITPEAIRLASGSALSEREQTRDQPSPGWSKLRRLRPGTEIVVTVAGAPSWAGHAVLSDDSGLTILNLEHPALSPDARRELLSLASDEPLRFSHERIDIAGRHVRLRPEGVFVADQRVADLGQILGRIARTDVRRIVRPARRRGSKWGALGGAAAGLWLGVGAAVGLATTQCGGSCTDEKALAWTAVIGLPVAGGFLGYHGFARKTEEVIYRAR
jgi:hypothetical protein